MNCTMVRPTLRTARLLACPVAIFALAATARAGELCVRCAGPEAQYRCQFEGAQAGAGAGLQLLCITKLAHDGGHQSCSIDRKSTPPCTGEVKTVGLPPADEDDVTAAPAPAPADGSEGAAAATPGPTDNTGGPAAIPDAGERAPGSEPPPPKQPGKQKWSEHSGPGDATAAEETPEESPATDGSAPGPEQKPIEKAGEAIGAAAKTAGTALDDAGSAVGNAAKKTWKCLWSLFGDC